MNNAARLIYLSSKFNHFTPLLHTLPWLPIKKTVIGFKLASLCFKSLNGSGPTYISDFLHLYIPSRLLRSPADIREFRIPSFHTRVFRIPFFHTRVFRIPSFHTRVFRIPSFHTRVFRIPSYRTKSSSQRSFSYQAPNA